ncbi:transcriptional regulator domain-containing protein [Porphyrobacter sp. ULC335]|uniref:transcriptional regulator domain-containing protein n=1 Tax=Porphyrobacter sp. ULC335 TaxID=2854260 RepID=UPI00221E6717|nr:DUF6499 domain-containing protein [Porphyrobacter sp. ULC335]
MARSESRYRQPDTHDFADYAQEFLRRNREYQRQFARLAGTRASAGESSAAHRMAHAWGLEFPLRSRLCARWCSGSLAQRLQLVHPDADGPPPSLAAACGGVR